MEPQGIVIHSTATPGATAQNEYNYFNSAYRAASAHYFIDWLEIIRTIPENEVAWHAGSTANNKYLSVEMCEPYGEDPIKFKEVWDRTVWLVASICVRYGWTTGPNVWSHKGIAYLYKQTDHSDPYAYLERYRESWTTLLLAIDSEIGKIKNMLEVGSINNLILVGRGPDERAAGYLADFLRAPVGYLDTINLADLEGVKNIYVIGGSFKPVDRAILISGYDRYETCQKVLEFIKEATN